MSGPRHFLDIHRLQTNTLRGILDRASAMKQARGGVAKGVVDAGAPLHGRVLAMVFEKPSTRTRVSYDIAMRQLGGQSVVLNASELQFNHGESPADTARVLSRYVDAIMVRTFDHETLLEMSRHATVPVINGLTDDSHPSQLMADVMTYEEHRGPIAGRHVSWLGDGNNMAKSWVHGAARFGYRLTLACPEPLRPPEKLLRWAEAEGADLRVTGDPEAAAEAADCIVTDTWVSMGDDNAGDRHNMLRAYRVDGDLMARAKPDAVFMHCLPAHRGEEVTAEVIDGPQSLAFDEAENRVHAQKGILTWCLSQ